MNGKKIFIGVTAIVVISIVVLLLLHNNPKVTTTNIMQAGSPQSANTAHVGQVASPD